MLVIDLHLFRSGRRARPEAGAYIALGHPTARPRTAAARAWLPICPRAARRVHCAARTLPNLFLLPRHILVPAGMMEPRPPPRDSSARHGTERSRLGGRAEVDVGDQADEEQDERDVVDQDAYLAE